MGAGRRVHLYHATLMNAFEESDGPGEVPGLVALPARSSSERLRLLLRLSETLAGTRTVAEVADSLLDLARQYLGAMFGGVAVVEGDTMHFASLQSLPAGLHSSRGTFAVSSPRPAAVAVRNRRALLFGSLSAALEGMDAESGEAACQSGGRSFAYVPMLLGRVPVGTVVLIWDHEVSFGEDDTQLLWTLARYSAQAVDRALLLADRRAVAQTLQAALLPILPTVSWLQMSGEYRPANLTETVGGDWYDAFVSEPGTSDRAETLTVAVGDVAGHDTHAATEMGRLQAKLRALAIDHPDEPHRLLQRLERVMTANVHNRYASTIAANLVPAADGSVAMSWCNAGHPPPLVVPPLGDAYFLDRVPDLLLGIGVRADRSAHSVVLPAGTTLVLYTDGLIERRHESLSDGMRWLADTVGQHRELPLAELTATIIEWATAAEHEDDTVLFGLRVPEAS